MENTYTPLKQYLPQGQDFSMSNLSNLAASKGMSGYKGTDEQNKQLYSSLSQPSSSPAVVSNYGMNSKVNDITNKSIQLGVVTPNQVAQNQQINNPQPQPQQIDYSTAPYQTDANGTKLYYNPSSGQYDQYETKGGVVNYGGMSVPSETLSDPYLKSIIDNQITAQKQNKTALDSQLEAIKNRFIQYRDTQNQLNQSGQAGVQNALLQSGAGNRGSVAQYAAATADARVNVMVQDGIKKLQELDNQEQELVSAARQAYESNNYKILSSINQAIEQKRQEQVAASAELNKRLVEETSQAKKDNAIAQAYEESGNDPVAILKSLNALGYKDISAKDVTETIQTLTNQKGIDDIAKEIAKAGNDPSIIKGAKTVSEAITLAGNALHTANNQVVKIGNSAYLIDKNTGKITSAFGAPITPKNTTTTNVQVTKEPLQTTDGKFLDYADPKYTITAIRSSKGGKDLTGEQSKPIQKALTALTQVDDVAKSLVGEQTGPIIGTIRSNNPYDTKAQIIKGQLQALVPNLARGVYGEVGVLTDADIENYSKTIANLKSEKEVNDAMIALTQKAAFNSIKNNLEVLAASKRDVSLFEPIYLNVEKNLNAKLGKYGSDVNSGASPVTNPIPKGALNDRDYVEKTVSAQSIPYDKLVNDTPDGQIPVVDNATGQVGYIPINEYNSSLYTKL